MGVGNEVTHRYVTFHQQGKKYVYIYGPSFVSVTM